ncbi:MAG: hypothetical protein GXP24_09340, partial [Planctomycetes bacterium]|nr:hypothetical protein [Planctomycetota bacterium]
FRHKSFEHYLIVNKALLALTEKMEHIGHVRVNDVTDIGDQAHIDTRSQRKMGKRFAQEIIRLQTAGEANQNEPIKVYNSKTLPAEIPCARIALGRKGDYKPCLAKLPNGELLIVAFDASHEKIDGGIREDMLLWRSTDDGRTWSKREVIPLLGREPYFSVLKDGTLLLTVHLTKQDIRNKEGYIYSLLHRSTDGGRTCSPPRSAGKTFPAHRKKRGRTPAATCWNSKTAA